MKIIKYNINDFADILDLQDFYTRIGVINPKTNSSIVKSVLQIKMYGENVEQLKTFLLHNQKLQKGRNKRLSKKEYERRALWEWVVYSPVKVQDIPQDEIWVEET